VARTVGVLRLQAGDSVRGLVLRDVDG